MGATQIEPSGGTDASDPEPESDEAGANASTAVEDALTEEELFTILSNRRRRYILHELMREGERLDIGALSQEIAAFEDDVELHEVSSSDRKRVYTALRQSHLPKMDEAGVVDFDRDRGTVEPTPALEDVEIYMDIVRGREIPWSDYYLGLVALSGLSLVAASVGPGPFASLSPSAWGLFVVVSFGVSAVAHRYYARRTRLGIGDDPSGVALEYRDD